MRWLDSEAGDRSLYGSAAIVTGAASGLGKEIARQLKHRGAHVAISDIDEEALGRTKRELGIDLAVHADVRDEESVQDLFQQVRESTQFICDGPYISVHNAGIGRDVRTVDSTVEDFQNLVDTNLKGVYLCTREALRTLEPKDEGVIVNIASAMVKVPGIADLGLYGLSKAGIEHFTQCAAKEYREQPGLRMFSILPGRMNTDLHRRMFPGYPEKRLLDPADAAKQIVNIIDGAEFIPTGQSFEIYK